MRRAYSYVRFSSLEQRLGDSLRRQMAQSEAWCLRHGATLDATLSLTDLGKSAFRGRNIKDGAFAGFLAACREGKVEPGSVLLLESLDRLSRDQIKPALRVFLEILSYGVDIVTFCPERVYSESGSDELAVLEALFVFSRSHEESKIKSHRARENWDNKRKHIGTKKMTGNVPAWLRLSKDRTRFELLADKVSIVRSIFQWASDGTGVAAIAKLLNKDKTPGIGRQKAKWHISYVQKILKCRQVLGELQPHIVRDGKRVATGEVVKDYYPAIITEDLFNRVQNGLKARTIARGRRGEGVANLFTGLIRDARDGCTMVIANKGEGRLLVSSGADRGEQGSRFVAFKYDDFERAFLAFTHELDARMFKDDSTEVEHQITALKDKLAEIRQRLADMKERLMRDRNFATLADAALALESEEREVSAELDRVKRENAIPRSEAIKEVKSAAEELANATDPTERTKLRERIKNNIRHIVKEIWMIVYTLNKQRVADVQVFFHDGTAREIRIRPNYTISSKETYPVVQFDYLGEGGDLRRYREQGGGWFESMVKSRRGYTEHDKATIRELREQGMSVKAIAAKLGKGQRTIFRLLSGK